MISRVFKNGTYKIRFLLFLITFQQMQIKATFFTKHGVPGRDKILVMHITGEFH